MPSEIESGLEDVRKELEALNDRAKGGANLEAQASIGDDEAGAVPLHGTDGSSGTPLSPESSPAVVAPSVQAHQPAEAPAAKQSAAE
jgi:hypothetical protein